ncbi:DUF4760 domain-containing protein [Celeribacter sp. ULVN23_4]
MDNETLTLLLQEVSHPQTFISKYGPLFSAGAVLISATVAFFVARTNIKEQRRIARRRATLDLLSRNEWDSDYLKARNEFNVLKNTPPGLAFWTSEDHAASPQIATIRSVLNDYEMIAIGIEEDILDEDLYLKWFRSSLLKDYELSKDAINSLREKHKVPSLYDRFELLAVKWEKR